jgi:hypothetical protein
MLGGILAEVVLSGNAARILFNVEGSNRTARRNGRQETQLLSCEWEQRTLKEIGLVNTEEAVGCQVGWDQNRDLVLVCARSVPVKSGERHAYDM